jgi:hypothetical protein
MGKFIDITGRTFGRWLVVGVHPERKRYGRSRLVCWVCRCDCCGVRRVVCGNSLRAGRSKSCGCSHLKHGHARRYIRSRAYRCWANMLHRCRDTRSARYANWGGRGIRVCVRWLIFENFYADMGDPPPGMSLDRIDNDGDYEPGNVRWATAAEQIANRRQSKQKARAALADITAFADAMARAAKLEG